MSFPKQILLAATLLLSAVSRTAAAPVTSLDLLSRSTDEAGHLLETRGDDVYLQFREAGEERGIGEIAKPKFPVKSKTTINKAKSPRKSISTRKHKESTTRTKKASGNLGAKKAKGSRKSASEDYVTRADSKKKKSRSGYRHDRGPERQGNGGRNQGSSQRSMRNIKRNNDQRPVSPLSSSTHIGDPSRVSPPSTNGPSTKPPSSKPPTPNPPSPKPPSTGPLSYKAPIPPPDLNKPLPPRPVGGFQKAVKKVKSFLMPKKG